MSRWNPDGIPKPCQQCERDYIAYMEHRHDLDQLAARDPERETWVADFEAWVEQQP